MRVNQLAKSDQWPLIMNRFRNSKIYKNWKTFDQNEWLVHSCIWQKLGATNAGNLLLDESCTEVNSLKK